jgi:hypothetical protein
MVLRHFQLCALRSIAEYVEEEREEAADTQLRTDAEGARMQPVRHEKKIVWLVAESNAPL